MKSSGAHFHVERLFDNAATAEPVILKGQNQVLKGFRFIQYWGIQARGSGTVGNRGKV